MSQDRHAALAIWSIERTIVKQIRGFNEKVINIFVNNKDRRAFFSTSNDTILLKKSASDAVISMKTVSSELDVITLDSAQHDNKPVTKDSLSHKLQEHHSTVLTKLSTDVEYISNNEESDFVEAKAVNHDDFIIFSRNCTRDSYKKVSKPTGYGTIKNTELTPKKSTKDHSSMLTSQKSGVIFQNSNILDNQSNCMNQHHQLKFSTSEKICLKNMQYISPHTKKLSSLKNHSKENNYFECNVEWQDMQYPKMSCISSRESANLSGEPRTQLPKCSKPDKKDSCLSPPVENFTSEFHAAAQDFLASNKLQNAQAAPKQEINDKITYSVIGSHQVNSPNKTDQQEGLKSDREPSLIFTKNCKPLLQTSCDESIERKNASSETHLNYQQNNVDKKQEMLAEKLSDEICSIVENQNIAQKSNILDTASHNKNLLNSLSVMTDEVIMNHTKNCPTELDIISQDTIKKYANNKITYDINSSHKVIQREKKPKQNHNKRNKKCKKRTFFKIKMKRPKVTLKPESIYSSSDDIPLSKLNVDLIASTPHNYGEPSKYTLSEQLETVDREINVMKQFSGKVQNVSINLVPVDLKSITRENKSSKTQLPPNDQPVMPSDAHHIDNYKQLTLSEGIHESNDTPAYMNLKKIRTDLQRIGEATEKSDNQNKNSQETNQHINDAILNFYSTQECRVYQKSNNSQDILDFPEMIKEDNTRKEYNNEATLDPLHFHEETIVPQIYKRTDGDQLTESCEMGLLNAINEVNCISIEKRDADQKKKCNQETNFETLSSSTQQKDSVWHQSKNKKYLSPVKETTEKYMQNSMDYANINDVEKKIVTHKLITLDMQKQLCINQSAADIELIDILSLDHEQNANSVSSHSSIVVDKPKLCSANMPLHMKPIDAKTNDGSVIKELEMEEDLVHTNIVKDVPLESTVSQHFVGKVCEFEKNVPCTISSNKYAGDNVQVHDGNAYSTISNNTSRNATLSTISGLKKKRKLYNPDDLSYLENTTYDTMSVTNVPVSITNNNVRSNANIEKPVPSKDDSVKVLKNEDEHTTGNLELTNTTQKKNKLKGIKPGIPSKLKINDKKTARIRKVDIKRKSNKIVEPNTKFKTSYGFQEIDTMFKQYENDKLQNNTTNNRFSFTFESILKSFSRELSRKESVRESSRSRVGKTKKTPKSTYVRVNKFMESAEIKSNKPQKVSPILDKVNQKVNTTSVNMDTYWEEPKVKIISDVIIQTKRKNHDEVYVSKKHKTRTPSADNVSFISRVSAITVNNQSPTQCLSHISSDTNMPQVSPFGDIGEDMLLNGKEINSWIATGNQNPPNLIPRLLEALSRIFIALSESIKGPICENAVNVHEDLLKITNILEKYVQQSSK